jgi:hypothetical protein
VHQGCIYTERGALRSAFPELPAHQQAVCATAQDCGWITTSPLLATSAWLCSHGDVSHGSAQSAGNTRAGGYVKHTLADGTWRRRRFIDIVAQQQQQNR